jgi:hypothetical protein
LAIALASAIALALLLAKEHPQTSARVRTTVNSPDSRDRKGSAGKVHLQAIPEAGDVVFI